jgi:hypothetical protein
MANMTVANTILQQLGGGGFKMMTGAKSFIGGDNYLVFRLPGGGGFTKRGINVVKIELTPADTYTVTFSKLRGVKLAEIATHEDVYADNLRTVFSLETGLTVSVPRFANL